MQVILPRGKDAATHLDLLVKGHFMPCDGAVLAFFEAFSSRILADREMRTWPEVMALAYWFRPAAVSGLCDRLAAKENVVFRPRGVALHFAPANVDSIFVYSWFLSMLCGNRNIVRISGRDSERRQVLLDVLAELLERPEHALIAQSNVVVSYPHNDSQSERLSELCQLRVIWGGDNAVRHIRGISLPPLATEVVFPNRSSWALFDAQAVLELSEVELRALALRFYNDAFWFGQQACSSPQAILWIGQVDFVREAQSLFWPAVREVLIGKGEENAPSEMMSRIVAAHVLAATGIKMAVEEIQSWPLRIQVDRFTPEMRAEHCGYGMFFEIERERLSDCIDLFEEADQTVAVFGAERSELCEWVVRLPDRSVDRVVPIGEALKFSPRWDGYDLLTVFSRVVSVL